MKVRLSLHGEKYSNWNLSMNTWARRNRNISDGHKWSVFCKWFCHKFSFIASATVTRSWLELFSINVSFKTCSLAYNLFPNKNSPDLVCYSNSAFVVSNTFLVFDSSNASRSSCYCLHRGQKVSVFWHMCRNMHTAHFQSVHTVVHTSHRTTQNEANFSKQWPTQPKAEK